MRPIEDIAREAAGGWDIVAYTRRTGPASAHGCYVENTVDDVLAMLTRFSAIVRAEALEDAWDAINAQIKPGPLSGNGCDATAERNGLVIAANTIHAMKDAHHA